MHDMHPNYGTATLLHNYTHAPFRIIMDPELKGHGGEFSGYYCKFTSIIDNKLLCVPYRSRNTEEVSMIVGVPECLGDPTSYCSLDPEIPPHFQQWLMVWIPRENAYKIINRHSGMLLCVQSRTDRENHRIVHYHDQALNFQWWEVQAFGHGEFKVLNKKSRKVLTAKDGSVVQQTSSESSQIQMWNIVPLEHSGFIGEYQIKNVNAGKLLCIKSESLSDNARAVIHDDRTGTVHEEFSNFQWWRLFVRGWDEGGFVLQNCHSGKILCISQRSMNSGTKAIQYLDQELSYQKWKLESVSPDRNLMKIANYSSRLMLSVQDSAQNNDAPVIQCEGKNLPFQFWEFIKLSEEINFHKLVKFFKSNVPQYADDELRDEDLGTDLSPELLQWYKNFIKMFMLEILAVVGVFPLPSQKQFMVLNHLILGNSSVFGTLQALLKTELSFDIDTIVEIVKLFREEDLWNRIFILLFEEVWSLPTLIKATAVINSLCKGGGTARTVFLLQKAAAILEIFYSIKPASDSSSDNDINEVDQSSDPESESLSS